MRFVVNVLASVSIFVVAGTSAADVHVGAGAGYFDPWEGEGGFSVMGQVLWSTGSERFRFGGEIGYSQYDTDFLGVSHVDVQSIPIRFIFQWIILPEAVVRPYLGVDAGFAVNIIDTDRIESEKPWLGVFSEVGASGGIAGIVGLEVPIGDHFAFFGEGRFGVEGQLTSTGDDIGAENLGGINALGGIRVRF